MESLIKGNEAFQKRTFPKMQPLFEELAKGQSPSTLFITCSDSRIDPALITQTEPGNLFVIRNAGNIIPPYHPSVSPSGEAASIEYAIDVLKVQEVIVCGHSRCGAIQYLLESCPHHLDVGHSIPMVETWLNYSKPILNNPSATTDTALAAQDNVRLQLEHLSTYPFVQKAQRERNLQIHGMYYELGNGKLTTVPVISKSFL